MAPPNASAGAAFGTPPHLGRAREHAPARLLVACDLWVSVRLCRGKSEPGGPMAMTSISSD